MTLRAIDILKEALKIFAKHSNFIFFAALTSLPLFVFSLYFENRLQIFLLQTSQFLQEENHETTNSLGTKTIQDYFVVDVYAERPGADWLLPLAMLRKLSNDLFQEFLHLGFLYLVPFNLLQLVSVIVIVDLASKIYREEKALTFKDMFGMRFDGERLQGIIVTFLFVVLFSTCTLIGFICLLITYSSFMAYFPKNRYFYSYDISYFVADISVHAIYGSNLMLLTGIYLAWSAIWNLGLVVSVLEGKYVVRALGSSAYLCLRNLQNGMVLMLVFSLWEMGSRLLGFLSFVSDRRWVFVVAQSGLFCLESAVKWVGFVVYFEDCIRRLFRKTVDVGEEES